MTRLKKEREKNTQNTLIQCIVVFDEKNQLKLLLLSLCTMATDALRDIEHISVLGRQKEMKSINSVCVILGFYLT